MDTEFFRFKVGEFDCIAIQDGIVDYHNPAETFFAGAPVEELDCLLKSAGINRESWPVYPSPYICLLINAGGQRILVDAGAGPLTPGTGKLAANLRDAGVTPEEIDLVVLTHGHPDHIGGIIRDGSPVFPNASYLMARKEWDFWFDPNVRSMLPVDDMWKTIFIDYVDKNLSPVKDKILLIEKDYQITPGVSAVICPGHTPGHLAIRVESGQEILYAISDLVLHPLNTQKLEWGTVFDQDKDLSARTKKITLSQIAAENANVLGFHFPFPGIGSVQPDGDDFVWKAK